ncbi:unnamed protein product, partial [Iphiclides podalirius]
MNIPFARVLKKIDIRIHLEPKLLRYSRSNEHSIQSRSGANIDLGLASCALAPRPSVGAALSAGALRCVGRRPGRLSPSAAASFTIADGAGSFRAHEGEQDVVFEFAPPTEHTDSASTAPAMCRPRASNAPAPQ